MNSEREITFRISETREDGKWLIDVRPSLKGIYWSNGGEQIILAIAANCVRAIARRDGLERALERFHDAVVNHTKPLRDDWPWNL